MSSRQEEKERRRRERLAKAAEAETSARRRRIVGLASGGVLAVAIVVAIVVAVAGGGGGSSDKKPKRPKSAVPIPAAQNTNLAAAAKAAGCTLHTFIPGPNDRNHVTTKVHYKQNPPVFGPHYPVPAHDGDYVGTTPPDTEKLVHPLEHGRVVIWYQPSLPARRIAQLETLFSEPIVSGAPEGYKQLLVSRASMPFEVAATSWGQQVGCPKFTDKTFDVIRAFRKTYVDHGPENLPFPE